MQKFWTWGIALAMMVCAWSGHAAAARKKAPAKKTSSAKSASKKPGANKKSASRVTWRNRQTAPTSDRYREIQNALVARGYLGADRVTGVWNDESTDAMKRFQADQKLDASGKINSLSLIALGLGPKREAVPPGAPKPAPTAGTSDRLVQQ